FVSRRLRRLFLLCTFTRHRVNLKVNDSFACSSISWYLSRWSDQPMKRVLALAALLSLLALIAPLLRADAPTKQSPKKALQAFNDLIGSWRGTGEPNGTREEKRRNFWQEKIAWEWQFKGDDVY